MRGKPEEKNEKFCTQRGVTTEQVDENCVNFFCLLQHEKYNDIESRTRSPANKEGDGRLSHLKVKILLKYHSSKSNRSRLMQAYQCSIATFDPIMSHGRRTVMTMAPRQVATTTIGWDDEPSR